MVLNRHISNPDRFFLLLEIIVNQMPETGGHPDLVFTNKFKDIAGILSISEQKQVMNRYLQEIVKNDLGGGQR